jgi:hypothetical protein
VFCLQALRAEHDDANIESFWWKQVWMMPTAPLLYLMHLQFLLPGFCIGKDGWLGACHSFRVIEYPKLIQVQ